ncbi:tRNA (adenosine(37)-N6)-threonylcarbamoyltransferase complex dimerization subunit type 1 TsaB [Winogradskyella sp.]|jgi:tRNA threonylcarbamoyladenosine biosynthesis protein TsaB|uniref:tRNA (adenosine(37)-N6)-threonylcarbamoyltransferase complex dimerization subunit type 1 TsaB n=1 Tax=Winogradskyella sp. TaxID=1883156 RepID=UPI0025EB0D22|nr:tRNA (adenosine(37)-N6)-threonylcarbamoyltransferase complex dimerization subunit type 1 TsaB [Winogradskyella sp.]MCT4630439.1 tRNA (adenosine(37)-N6)-threonylcarbamoyltransferase complex dimerization subunit type 1 TsaB [Winogradskyella sp.]
MALVLNIETATTNCSVSLSKDGEILVLKEDNSLNYSHAETLHVFIKEVFEVAKIKPEEIDAVAVSKGPGSYTGLRIGVSSAKGLCFALNKPLISVSTLESLAHQVNTEQGYIVSMLDARRMEVYSAILTNEYGMFREVKAEVLSEDSYADLLKEGKVYFVGNGVEKTKQLIDHPNAIFVEGKLPSAREMAVLSNLKYKKSDIEDVAYFEPFYLKDFIAIKKKN